MSKVSVEAGKEYVVPAEAFVLGELIMACIECSTASIVLLVSESELVV